MTLIERSLNLFLNDQQYIAFSKWLEQKKLICRLVRNIAYILLTAAAIVMLTGGLCGSPAVLVIGLLILILTVITFGIAYD